MNNFFLSFRSNQNLKGVNSDLIRVVREAILITNIDFMVIEGLRSFKRQKTLYMSGHLRL